MEIRKRMQGDVAIIDIEGEIKRMDISDVTLHQVVKDNLEAGLRNILLNLEKVQFIDSFGVGEILASFISTQNLGGKFKMARISKKIFLIFDVTMLTRVLEIFDTEESALQSFPKV